MSTRFAASGVPAGLWRAVLLVLGLAAAGLAAWTLWEAQRLLRADWGSMAAREQVQQWVARSGAPVEDEPAWQAVVDALQRALAVTPDDPDLHERLGDAFLAAGQRDAADEARSRQHHAAAVEHYQRATVLRPIEPGTWAVLAVARQAAGHPAEAVFEAWRRALALGPFEGHVRPLLLQVVLADWDKAPADTQAWALALFDGSTPQVQRQINVLARRYGLMFSPDAPATPP